MIKKFVVWFVWFGLSFLIESLGWTDQGRAFLYINCVVSGLIIVLIALGYLFGGSSSLERLGVPIGLMIFYAIAIGILLLATWGATKLFDVDFFVAYQIMSFGQCLCPAPSKKDE